jgi:hypothetical protein
MRYIFSQLPFLAKFFLLGSLIILSNLAQSPHKEAEIQTSPSTERKMRNDSTSIVPSPSQAPQFESNFSEKVSWSSGK